MINSSQPAKRIRRRRIIIFIGAAIVLLWCGLLARDSLALRADWQALQADLSASSQSQADLSALQAHVLSLYSNVVSLRSHAGPLLAITPAFSWLPGIGGDLKSAPALLEMATELLDGGERALGILAPLWPPKSAGDRSTIERIARGLDTRRSDLMAVQVSIDRAGEIRQQIDPAALSPSVRPFLDRFDAAYPTLRAGAQLLAVAPQLLGADRPRTYLILFQNEDELRPTGGFISAAGRITLDAGRIVTLTVVDSYQVDDFSKPYGNPPAPLLDYMGSELWVFRDSNWSPDFPTAARKAIELYTYTHAGPIDGVIGLNQKVVQALVAGLGPLQIDPNAPALTPDNMQTYMQAAWNPSGQSSTRAWMSQRKDFIGRLMQVILDRALHHADQIHWLDLGQALNEVLHSHDLLMYLVDPTFNQPLARAGWDGALQATDGDYLMIVDANLGFNKANLLMQQSLAYTVTLGANGVNQAELTLTYTNTGKFVEGCVHQLAIYALGVTYDQLAQQCYWDYRRVLTPAGAQLIEATRRPIGPGELITGRTLDGSTATANEDGKTVFSTLLIVGRGQHFESRLRYLLPADVVKTAGDQRIYQLRIQKQPGAGGWPVRIMIVWPPGQRLVKSDPAPISTSESSAVFQAGLQGDYQVKLTWGGEH